MANRKERRAAEKAKKKTQKSGNISQELGDVAGPIEGESGSMTVDESGPDDTMHRLLDAKIEIPVSLLRQKHIFIATPCYGGQIGEPYFRSMMRLAIMCNKYEIPYTVSTLANESLVTRGRNTLVSFFMENTNATHLFFIDADIEFNPEDLLRMVAYDKATVLTMW